MSASRELSAGLRSPAGARTRKRERAAAGGVGRQLELHRQHLAVAAEGDLPAIQQVAGLCRTLRVPDVPHAACAGYVAGGPRQDLHRHRLSRHPLGLKIAGHRVMVAGIGPGRHDQVAHGHVGRLAVGAEADGEDGDFRLLGQFDGGLGRDAGVLPAVAEDDDARDRRAALFLNQLPQRLAEPRFASRSAPAAWPNRAACRSRPVCRSAVLGRRSATGDGLCRCRQLAQRHHAVALQVFAELEHRHVVRLAKPREKIGLLQRGRDLLRPRVAAAVAAGCCRPAVRRRSGPCSDSCRPAATRGSSAPPRAPNANAAASTGSATRGRPPSAARSAANPTPGRSSTASRRYSQRTNNRIAMQTAIGRIQSAFDWMRPHSNVVRTASAQQRQEGVRHAAPPCGRRRGAASDGSWPTTPGSARRSTAGQAVEDGLAEVRSGDLAGGRLERRGLLELILDAFQPRGELLGGRPSSDRPRPDRRSRRSGGSRRRCWSA